MKVLSVALIIAAALVGSATAAPKVKHFDAKAKSGPQVMPGPAVSAPLKVFDFQGYDTETAADPVKLAAEPQKDASGCSSEGVVTSCTNYDDPVIAGRSTLWLTKKFNSGKLYYVYDAFGEYAIGDILSAFTQKYGSPHIENRKWQSKAGSVFDNTVYMWDFKGGKLELDSMGLKVDQGSFEFVSTENAPPEKPAKVDF